MLNLKVAQFFYIQFYCVVIKLIFKYFNVIDFDYYFSVNTYTWEIPKNDNHNLFKYCKN